MNKNIFKRFGLGFLQHIIAVVLMIALAIILSSSYIDVTSMKETKTYWLDPLDTEPIFEDTDMYRNIRNTTVSDILKYVSIREQLESNGVFDPDKRISITHYAGKKDEGYNCNVTAVYTLEDLIKWGKVGVEYNTRAMSMSDFVNYFGDAAAVENFGLDEYGQLCFTGFNSEDFIPEVGKTAYLYGFDDENADDVNDDTVDKDKIVQAMSEYTQEQLEDMAFSYIMAVNNNEINVSREEDGTLTVYINMISCRYGTVDGVRQIADYAGNWLEYIKLQQNLASTIESMHTGYELYQNASQLYSEGNTNLTYVIRMMSENGVRQTYTNDSTRLDLRDEDITESFSESRKYFIYYLDNLEFTGLTDLTEGDVYRFMTEQNCDFPEDTRIWISLDTTYSVEGDAFSDAYIVFSSIVPNIVKILVFIVFLVLMWLLILGYLTTVAGVGYSDDGEVVYYTSGIDKIWTEIMLLAAAALVYAGYRATDILSVFADNLYSSTKLISMNSNKLYEYGVFGLVGAGISIMADIIWLSFVRRVRGGIVWSGSFVFWLIHSIKKGAVFVSTHRNMAINTLLPYNMFLLINLIGGLVAYNSFLSENITMVIVSVLCIVTMDGLVGVMIFRRNAERTDIVDGICRIRDGEVEYKLEVDSLTGSNRELADAVNNIGEGIKKAVHTSMKDEQMKSDLITNVSHDIKTPLTSIINYVDLLKRIRIEDEPDKAKGYIEVLDEKSQRLKQLTDDLLEASKISSGNITLNIEKLNLTELLNQTIGEYSEKLGERGLSIVFDDGDIQAYVDADSRRMWRVMDNLFNNIYKYALDNTRVYVDIGLSNEDMIELSVKNISATRMNIKGDELTERFIRGDSSRTTEGSGLGLFIAKSLTEAQGGTFEIRLDGDLFKVLMIFPKYASEEQETI